MAESNVAQETLNKVATSLPEALAKIIDKTLNAVDSGVEFLSNQIPDVIHQLLLYNMVWALMWWAISIIVIVACVTFIVKGVKACQADRIDEDLAAGIIIPCAIVIIIFTIVFANNWDWMKIWLAPKLYLIEYATQLYKSLNAK